MSDVRFAPVEFDPFADTDAPFALTEPQREMVAAALMGDEANCSYNQCFLIALRGPLSVESMRNALLEVVRRHDALRLSIDIDSESQRVLADLGVELPLTDLSALGEAEREAAIARIADRETHTPFDLRKAPLWRASIVREAPDRHRLVFTAHHVVVDGWSSAVIFGDLAKCYAADRFGVPPSLPPAASYRDFVAAQERPAIVAERDAALEFWAAQYASGAPAFELPLDRPRPALKTYTAGRETLAIDKTLYKNLRTVAAREGATLFVALLAAFEALVTRLASADDIVVGVPFASQALEENGHLVAHGVNTMPLRARVDAKQTFAEHLRGARTAFLDAQAHPRLTFGTLVQNLRLPRDPSRTPLVSVIFNIDKLGSPFDFGELSVAGIEAPKAFFNFELGINAIDDGASILLECDFNANLFRGTTVARWLVQYRTLLERITANAKLPLAELGQPSDEERARLLGDAPIPNYATAHATLHESFAAQVAKTPDAVALTFDGGAQRETLTYAELDRRAEALAAHLCALGIGANELVGLRVERSADVVVGLLAILKAGGAYLPLDPVYPTERIAFMLNDAGVRLVLTQRRLADALSSLPITSICLDEPIPAASARTSKMPSGEDLAYVIYTSGSTGQPKGVRVTHRNVLRLFSATEAWFGFGAADVWTLFHSYAFDFSVWEIWGALLYGGRVVVVPQDLARDPASFRELLIREKVTVLNQTPTAFRQLIDADRAVSPASYSLRHVVFGGEALELQSLKPWFDRYGDKTPQLNNMYGITETTVHVTYRPITKADVASGAGSVIGVPIPDLRVYLLDAYGQPVSIGVPGEMYVAGAGVAAGYLNRPELTAQRFVEDPFHGGRMYRSGDLARRLDDGELEYLGRIDQQVKIRGFRIELGEIEAEIAKHPAIRQVAVIDREDAPGEKKLVAYLIAADNANLTHELREALRRRLPDYMVPSAFVPLDVLPLTNNGKLDRKALPDPGRDAFARQAYEAPQGDLEIALAAIWAELLDVERVGRHDHFFELGGHSLLAVRLVNRVAHLGTELPLASVFASPVFGAFAHAVAERRVRNQLAVPAIARLSRDGALPLSFAQQRLWFLAQLEDINDTYRIPLILRLRGRLDHAAWRQTLDALFARHDALRTTFVVRDNGEPEVRLLDAGVLPYHEHDLRGIADAEDALKRLCDEDAHAPFDLARGPLMRVRLIQTADDAHVVLLTQHHIVFDGWSTGVLARELSMLYAAFLQNRPDPLPPLAIQYPDYAAWQREWLTGERLRGQADYWRDALAGAPALISLPTDRPRPAQQSFQGSAVPIRLDTGLTRALKQLGRQHGTTLFMTLLAAWASVLSRLSGQDDVVIGTPSANRGRAEVESLIGCFINTLALRIDLTSEPTTTELLERVRQTALAAQDHQDLPFEQVVELLQPPRRLDHTPLFQVMFVWQNHEAASFDLPGVRLESLDISDDSVKFDLELALGEADDEVVGALSYATSLFDAATIQRHRDYLVTVLRAMVATADQPVQRIDLLPAAERTLLLDTWNRTDVSYAEQLRIHELFEQQVGRSPDAVAVVFGNQRLTYAELNARANRLAHTLIERGVAPDARVAICVERSLALIVGLLAILKAGGAYVPLDPAYPSERLAHVLADAQPCLLLADVAGRSALGRNAIGALTVLDLDSAALDTGDASNPRVAPLTPRHLAYVIYTSGSTGTPKGVMIEHRSVVNFLRAMSSAPGLFSHDHLLAVTSVSFDIAGLELYLPLSLGAQVILASRDEVADAMRLHTLIDEHAISVIQATPATWRLLLPLPEHARRDLVALVGGEALPADLSIQLGEAVSRLWNLYGPTETTIWSTTTRIDAGTPSDSIGRPIANTRLYLLDRYGQPVPLGAVGELYIGGDGVARGYFNRPDLTAERFVRDPFSPHPRARMYKTGDLARYLPDGNVAFLGRNDHQVKIRGYRIEPGEIEARLTEHPAVRQAVVLALGEDVDKRLVAYVAADASPDLVAALREHLSARLPDYMVPTAFVELDAFPLTPNGKLDRRALPAPAETRTTIEHVAPRTASEALVVAAFNNVLERADVGVFDDFFELGGHSLKAARVMANLRAAAKVDLPLRNLFERPTPAQLGAAIDALSWSADEDNRATARDTAGREEIEL